MSTLSQWTNEFNLDCKWSLIKGKYTENSSMLSGVQSEPTSSS